MEGQSGAARVVPTGSVHQQHVERLVELSDSLREERTFPKSQQARLIGAAGDSPDGGGFDTAPGLEQGGTCPADVAGRSGSATAASKTDKHAGNTQHAMRKLEQRWIQPPEMLLLSSEIGGRARKVHDPRLSGGAANSHHQEPARRSAAPSNRRIRYGRASARPSSVSSTSSRPNSNSAAWSYPVSRTKAAPISAR